MHSKGCLLQIVFDYIVGILSTDDDILVSYDDLLLMFETWKVHVHVLCNNLLHQDQTHFLFIMFNACRQL